METNVLSLTDLLWKGSEMKGSDLHLSAGSPSTTLFRSQMLPLTLPALATAETKRLAYSVMTDDQKFRYEQALQIDFIFGVKGLARFRANVFTQRGAVSAVFRLIPFGIQSFEELNVPPIMERLCEKPRGMVLITGPTGSGKTTTLAAMIDKINREKRGHIITIEDPIEFLHEHKSCVINQREVHADTHSFTNALRVTMREDPDVVLVGEMRDLETSEAALRIADTGHMPFATLHTH